MRAVLRLHARHRRQNRHGRLAHGEDVEGRSSRLAQVFAHFGDVIDVIVEIELADRQGNPPGVNPIGDIDVMGLDKGFHRAAQKRRVMARHGGDDQQAGLGRRLRRQVALEMQDLAEGAHPHDFLVDRDFTPVDQGFVQAESRLAIAAGHALE